MSEECRLLFVCSANLCRSVTAAEYARRAVIARQGGPIEWFVSSAGTAVGPGQSVPTKVAEVMNRLGIEPRKRPMPVSESYVRKADVILTAERHHRGVVARRFPFAVRYTFTLLEFAQLLKAGRAASPSFDVRSSDDLLTLARFGRGHVQLEGDDLDIADPIEARSSKAMASCARMIESAIAEIIV